MSEDGAQLSERHNSLYFMDGNIVLQAPLPDKSVLLFRIHKSVLSFHSPIFSDMFGICNTTRRISDHNDDHFYDGIPLVHMPDDANHLESVLKILYYQSTLPWTPYSPHYPALITPILDLSRKYGIDRMREQIQRHLESDWPQTLKDWDKLERDIQFMLTDSNDQSIDDHFPEPASAIKLAHEFDIPSILPAAFYHLSRLSIKDDWDKAHADVPVPSRSPTKRTAQWRLLSAKDFRCFLLGKAEITEILRGCIRTREFPPERSPYGIRTGCNKAGEQWGDICNRCSQSADPLALLKIEGDKHHHCSACTEGLKKDILDARTHIWEKLGDLFHLKDD